MMEMFIAGMVVGVLLMAYTDRIRGVRTVRYRVEREHAAPRVVEADIHRRRAPSRPPAPATAPVRKDDDTQATVISALVGAGYSRDIAMKAAASVASNDRTTVENWTRAALRRALTQ